MNKTHEALKMAIDALENLREAFMPSESLILVDVIEACKEVIVELELQEMAENAKELGLDYCKHGGDCL